MMRAGERVAAPARVLVPAGACAAVHPAARVAALSRRPAPLGGPQRWWQRRLAALRLPLHRSQAALASSRRRGCLLALEASRRRQQA